MEWQEDRNAPKQKEENDEEAVFSVCGSGALRSSRTQCKNFEPLIPVQTIELPDVPEGPYTDHLCVDTKGTSAVYHHAGSKSVVVYRP